MPELSVTDFIEAAESVGVRLEMVAGTPYWEAMPGRRHHDALMDIRDGFVRSGPASNGCGCYGYVELLIRFPDGSLKTPDLSIFCERPAEPEGAVTAVPEAVVEIISPGFERKDLEIGPPFYLSQGVRDVVVYDPRSQAVTHFRAGFKDALTAPISISLACGCSLHVPLTNG